MQAAKVQASLRIRAVSPEPSLLAHTSSGLRGTFRQKARPLAPLNGWACAVKIGHGEMLEDTNSLDGAHLIKLLIPLTLPMSLFNLNPLCITQHINIIQVTITCTNWVFITVQFFCFKFCFLVRLGKAVSFNFKHCLTLFPQVNSTEIQESNKCFMSKKFCTFVCLILL